MPNGMESDKFKYKVLEGTPSKELLQEILVVYKSIFDDYKLDFFKQRIHKKEGVLLILCYQQKQLIGFKIGYRYNDITFYSWVGGVLPENRKKGIAKTLAHMQEQKIKEKGYQKMRTKSTNRIKTKMILNLKNGFDIVKVYTNDIGQTKVVFEKLIK